MRCNLPAATKLPISVTNPTAIAIPDVKSLKTPFASPTPIPNIANIPTRALDAPPNPFSKATSCGI